MARLVSFVVLVGILAVIAVMFYHVIASFILPIFLATLLVVIFQPLHLRMLKKTGQKSYVAAALTTAAVLGIVLIPLVLVCFFAVSEAASSVTQINVGTLRDRLAATRVRLGLDIPQANAWRKIEGQLEGALLAPREKNGTAPQVVPATLAGEFDKLVAALRNDDDVTVPEELVKKTGADIKEVQERVLGSIEYDAAVQEALQSLGQLKQQVVGRPLWLKELANPSDEEFRDVVRRGLTASQDSFFTAIGNTTAFLGKTLVGLIILIVSMFFFFADGPKLVEHVMDLTPLDRGYQRELLVEFDRVSRAVVVATLLSAVVQGLLAGVGYYFAGLESVFLLTLLTTVFAMVPFIGSGTVWVPASLWLYFYEERTLAAILLALYGALVVSLIDNIIKPWVLHGQSNLHPLAALLGILGGVQALGPIGILVGPMVFVFLATLLRILQRELKRMDKLPGDWMLKR